MAIQFVRDQLINAIINADKLDANAVVEAKIDNGAVAFDKLKSADIETDLSVSASSSKLADANAIKSYVDSEIAELAGNSWKDSCVAATTGTLSATYNHSAGTITAAANGAISIDGVSLSLGDRVLVKNATSSGVSGEENCGIYNVTTVGDGSNPYVLTRASDMDSVDEIRGTAVMVQRGTVNISRAYYVHNFGGIFGTDNITFERFRQFSAGDGLELSATNGPQDVLQLDLKANESLQIVSTELALVLDGSTLSQSASGLAVANDGITEYQMDSGSFGDGLTGGSGTVVSVDLKSNAGLSFDTAQLQVKLKAESGGSISVDADGLYIADSAISNAKLANSTISGVSLGGTLGSLSTATNGGIALTSYDGSSAVSDLAMNIADLSAEVINPANDEIAFADSDGGTKKESVADFVSAIKGNGLTSSAGVFSVLADGGTITVGGSGIKVSDASIDTQQMADDAITMAKLGILPATDLFSPNGSTASFTLANRIAVAQLSAFESCVRVYRNGQRLKPVASSPADASEYSIADTGSATQITLGANPASGELLIVDYWY